MTAYAILDMETRCDAERLLDVVEAASPREAFVAWLEDMYVPPASAWEIRAAGREWMKVGSKRMPVKRFEALLPTDRAYEDRRPEYEEETGLVGVRLALDSEPPARSR